MSLLRTSIFIFFYLTAQVVLAKVKFSICGNGYDAIEISECDSSSMNYCPLKRGTQVNIKLTFTTKQEVKMVHSQIRGNYHGVVVSLPRAGKDNACIDSGLDCPLKANKQYTYHSVIPIQKIYPKVSVAVEYELKDDKMNSIACVRIPTKIV